VTARELGQKREGGWEGGREEGLRTLSVIILNATTVVNAQAASGDIFAAATSPSSGALSTCGNLTALKNEEEGGPSSSLPLFPRPSRAFWTMAASFRPFLASIRAVLLLLLLLLVPLAVVCMDVPCGPSDGVEEGGGGREE